MTPRAIAMDAVLDGLRANPARISSLLATAPDDRRRARPRADAWSAGEIFGHVRACADVWGGHIAAILSESPDRLPAGDPRAWAQAHGYQDADFEASFAAYAEGRAALIDLLAGLPAADWSRSALMIGSASRTQRSVGWHAEHIVRHEDQHVTEIRRALKAAAKAG
jgi:hypothetical protein